MKNLFIDKSFANLLAIGAMVFSLSSFSSSELEADSEFGIRCTCRQGQCVADGAGGSKCNANDDCSAWSSNCFKGVGEIN